MGKNVGLLLAALLLVSSCMVTVAPVMAEGRTIVVPDDFPNIASAVGNATNGDTIFVRSGRYEGPINKTIVIDKSISIIGEDVENTTIELYPAYNVSRILTAEFLSCSDAITITANDCRLLNLTFIIAPGGKISVTGNQTQRVGNNITRGYLSGIRVQGSYCRITDNYVSGSIDFSGFYSCIARNSLRDSFDYSISICGSSNVVKENDCQDLSLSNSTNNVFSGNKLWGGDSLGWSGIDLLWSNNNLFYKNELSGFDSGFRFWFSSENIVTANTIANSFRSIHLGASYDNRIYLNNFIEHDRGSPYVWDDYADQSYRNQFPDIAPAITIWDNGSLGNYWENYSGTDVNGDGIGDSPYILRSDPKRGDLDLIYGKDIFPLMSPVNIDSVAVPLPDWASLAFHLEQLVVVSLPQNITYTTANVALNFTLTPWAMNLQYSMDGKDNVTLTSNTTLSGLADGPHRLTLYAEDPFGNVLNLATVDFSVKVQEPFPTVPVGAVSGVAAVVACVLALYIRKKRLRGT
jgi:nitrous oxidase accessory protein